MAVIITFLPKVSMVCIHLSRSPDLCSNNSVRLLLSGSGRKWHRNQYSAITV